MVRQWDLVPCTNVTYCYSIYTSKTKPALSTIPYAVYTSMFQHGVASFTVNYVYNVFVFRCVQIIANVSMPRGSKQNVVLLADITDLNQRRHLCMYVCICEHTYITASRHTAQCLIIILTTYHKQYNKCIPTGVSFNINPHTALQKLYIISFLSS